MPELFSSVIFLNKARVKVVLASVKGVEDAIVSDTKKETWENNETLTVLYPLCPEFTKCPVG